MRVRTFELRLIAIGLVACWTLTAGLVLLAYRPGGPIDLLVGLFAAGPVAIAASAVAWPPVARGQRAFPAMVWLGVGAVLFLVPSMMGFYDQIRALGSQTLLPSPEAGYPWFLALLATSLFAGFGLARRVLGQTAMRRQRLLRGTAMALVMTALSGSLFAGAAIANDISLRGRPTAESRFGPTDPDADPPLCADALEAGPSARLALRMGAQVDLRPVGSLDLAGLRAGDDVRWLAWVASERELGTYGAARVGDRTWTRTPRQGWQRAGADDLAGATLDTHVLAVALPPDFRATAEDRGIEVIGGARARRCRVAIDGPTFLAAFPQTRWLIGDADLERWRGQLDYWVFLDGQLGQVAGSVNGEATGVEPDALLATIDVRLTATERRRGLVVYPPAR